MRTRFKFAPDGGPHFLTDTVVGWLPVFCRPSAAQVILDSWKFLQSKRGIRIHAYVILENHIHWIASGEGLSETVKRFKSFTARSILDVLKSSNACSLLAEMQFLKARHKTDQELQFWQEGSHPQQITSEEMMWQKIEYIHNNPLRRGYVDDPLHWRYSSARNYARMVPVIEIDTDW
jgi:putative transposase